MVEAIKVGYDEERKHYIVHIHYKYNKLQKIFGRKDEIKSYYGDCTVWRDLSTHRRVGTLMEYWLCDILASYKFNTKHNI